MFRVTLFGIVEEFISSGKFLQVLKRVRYQGQFSRAERRGSSRFVRLNRTVWVAVIYLIRIFIEGYMLVILLKFIFL